MRIIRTHEDIEAGLAGLMMLDARLAQVIVKAGPVPLRRMAPGYRGVANIIVSQMVSKASAAAIWQRMETALGEVSAAGVLLLNAEDCRLFGLSRAKAGTLQRVAEATVAGQIDLDAICNLDAAAAVRELTAIKGIGRWTAEVYLLFCAGHPDVFPSGDVALQNAIGHALGFEPRPTAPEIDALAASWSPWRGVAARLFWAYYAQEMRRDALPVALE